MHMIEIRMLRSRITSYVARIDSCVTLMITCITRALPVFHFQFPCCRRSWFYALARVSEVLLHVYSVPSSCDFVARSSARRGPTVATLVFGSRH